MITSEAQAITVFDNFVFFYATLEPLSEFYIMFSIFAVRKRVMCICLLHIFS